MVQPGNDEAVEDSGDLATGAPGGAGGYVDDRTWRPLGIVADDAFLIGYAIGRRPGVSAPR